MTDERHVKLDMDNSGMVTSVEAPFTAEEKATYWKAIAADRYKLFLHMERERDKLRDELRTIREITLKACDIIVNNPKGSYRGQNAGSISAEAYTYLREALLPRIDAVLKAGGG